jgi:hypothetical protein
MQEKAMLEMDTYLKAQGLVFAEQEKQKIRNGLARIWSAYRLKVSTPHIAFFYPAASARLTFNFSFNFSYVRSFIHPSIYQSAICRQNTPAIYGFVSGE